MLFLNTWFIFSLIMFSLGFPCWTSFSFTMQVKPANLSELIPQASPEALNLIMVWIVSLQYFIRFSKVRLIDVKHVKHLCAWDPQKRPTAEQSLHHPFFNVISWCCLIFKWTYEGHILTFLFEKVGMLRTFPFLVPDGLEETQNQAGKIQNYTWKKRTSFLRSHLIIFCSNLNRTWAKAWAESVGFWYCIRWLLSWTDIGNKT